MLGNKKAGALTSPESSSSLNLMPAIPVSQALMSVEEFLAAEPGFQCKHDYVAGALYERAEADIRHNTIAANLLGMLHARLRGKAFGCFGSEMKVKLRIAESICFYYPDAMIVCGRTGDSWTEAPKVIFEIVSDSTRTFDEREKRMTYMSIVGLDAYVLIEQNTQRLVVDRQDRGRWEREILEGADAVLKLPKVDVELPVGELYERVDENTSRAR
jgi:Uma2 family endonuclease